MLIELFLLYSQSSRISLDSIWEWIHSSSLALSESLLISWLRTLVGFYFVFNLREMHFYPSFFLVIFSTYLFLQLHRVLVASCETRYWTQALCTGKRSFSHWITREVPFPPNFCFYNLLCLPKNWCFQTVVLEKTLERPLDYKEIKPVNLKGNHSWILIGRTDAEAEAPILWRPDAKNCLIGKDWCWARLKAGGEGDDRGWDGWMASLTQWTWTWANSGRWWGTEKPGMLQSMGWQAMELDTNWQLNNCNTVCLSLSLAAKIADIFPLFPMYLTFSYKAWMSSFFSELHEYFFDILQAPKSIFIIVHCFI